MASSAKRCLYEVLGVHRDCSADEIRSAYKKLALQRHPDKLVQSGIPEGEATTAFQELVNAYEVLSDPRERAWYDSNRNQILFSSSSATSGTSSHVPDLFPFFSNSAYSGFSDSGRGFYKVFGDLFQKIYSNELSFAKKLGVPAPREAPVMGNLESPYAQVTAFYNHWMGFTTVLEFFWVDEVGMMPNRKSRRLLEEHNKKLRKSERKKYNDIVRQLAEFVKKRDKRVRDMQIKKNEELKKKKELEKQRMKDLERQKAEKARNYEEPDWAKVEEVEEDEVEDELEEKRQEFYCVACSKKFKSDKQWKNHEQSKKHKEKVMELQKVFHEEENDSRTTEENKTDGEEELEENGVVDYLSADDMLNALPEQFQSELGIKDDNRKADVSGATESDEYGTDEASTNVGFDEDESTVLEAMLTGQRNRNKVGNQPKIPAENLQVDNHADELEFMEYNNVNGSRRNRRGRRQRDGGRQEEEAETGETDVSANNTREKANEEQDNGVEEESISKSSSERETENGFTRGRHKKIEAKTVNMNAKKKGSPSKSKVPSKRSQQQKVGSNSSDNACEKCGEEFESRNKLHKHLGETGHASLKYR